MDATPLFSLVNSAGNMTLPASAAERRAAAPLLLSAGTCSWYAVPAAVDRYNSKPHIMLAI